MSSRAQRIIEQLEMTDGVRVSANPSRLSRLAADLHIPFPIATEVVLRALVDQNTKDLFVWDAHEVVHDDMQKSLGLQVASCYTLRPPVPGYTTEWEIAGNFENPTPNRTFIGPLQALLVNPS